MQNNSKKKRVLVVGDNHMTDKLPTMRSDDYGAACLSELCEIFQIARDQKVQLVLFLGDIFDKIQVGKEYLDSVLRVFAADENGTPWPFRKAAVVGNHDIKHNMQLYPLSALCTLASAGVLEIPDYLPDFRIGFAHFRATLDAELADGLLAEDSKKPLIWAAHANITTQPVFGDYVLFKDLRTNSECRLVVAGHIHMPMEQKIGDVQFINPGNVGRKDATKENLGRDVRVLCVEYTFDGSSLEYNYIKLESALPSALVFKIAEIQEKKDTRKETMEFLGRASQLSLAHIDNGDRSQEILVSARLKGIPDEIALIAAEEVRAVMEIKGKR